MKRPGGQKRRGEPPQQQKGKKRRSAADVYEAEESDPDEMKNTNRYDVGASVFMAATRVFLHGLLSQLAAALGL